MPPKGTRIPSQGVPRHWTHGSESTRASQGTRQYLGTMSKGQLKGLNIRGPKISGR